MQKVEPRTLAGFMELLPAEQIAFNSMLDTIRRSYELFGFTPIETPAIEYSDVLLAKAGGETEKQIYRFMRGDNDLCLHFDLTVPLARYVAEHYGQLTFPFRRYQIQKVWRAERPQKGRFREFYQCDIDIIGSKSPLVDAEIPSVIYSVFTTLGFDRFTIRVSNRKVLNGFLESLGLSNLCQDILRLVDKIEKQDRESLATEIEALGISRESVEKIFVFVGINGTTSEIISQLQALGVQNSLFEEGLSELKTLVEGIATLGVPEANYKIDLTIARGLDYYTGTVYETVLDDYPSIGSVCSGGRYDDLASYYTDVELPGVGISIGLTRLFDQLRTAGLLKIGQSTPSKVLIVQVDSSFLTKSLEIATELRKQGIPTEIYLEDAKLGKQLKYANKLQFPFVAIVGMNEAKDGEVVLKNMTTAEQSVMSIQQAADTIKE